MSAWCFFEPSMKKEAYKTMLLKNSLRHAVELGELVLHYQPKVYAKNGVVDGFEVLLRWNSSDHGSVLPLQFIPLAEETGLIHPIGAWVLREACKFIRKVGDMGKTDIHVAVNISPHQLSAEGFILLVSDIVRETGIHPKQLELEITESVLLASLEGSIRKLHELQSMGIRVSLDDFGSGYSSLPYLRHLPVQTLKLDKTFINEIPKNLAQSAIVKAVIDMAHILDMVVVAEGVERGEQLEYLKLCRCDVIQGYLISRPIPEDEAIRFLLAQQS